MILTILISLKGIKMIKISNEISLDEKLIKINYVHSSGPGGQNVNKVATVAQLRFDLGSCDSLSEQVKLRLYKIAKSKISNEEILIIEAKRFRFRERNKLDAIDRLIILIKKALIVPKKRKKNRPGKKSKEKRINDKKKRGNLKKTRKSVSSELS